MRRVEVFDTIFLVSLVGYIHVKMAPYAETGNFPPQYFKFTAEHSLDRYLFFMLL